VLELGPGGLATRYLIGVVADGEHVWAVLDAAFRERLTDASSACLVQPLKSVRSRCLRLPSGGSG
jgi:hypothetical protein